MSRHAVRTGFEGFVEDVVEQAYDEFDVVGAVKNGTQGGHSKVVSNLVKQSDALDRHVVQPLLEDYQKTILEQFDHVVAYAADADGAFDEYAADVLQSDLYFHSLRPDLPRDRQAEVERRLLDRQRRLGEAIEPLVQADGDEFWPTVTRTFDREEAETFVRSHFAFTDPLSDHREAFAFRTDLDPSAIISGPLARGLPSISIDYTEEAVRTMRSAEDYVIEETLTSIDKRYSE